MSRRSDDDFASEIEAHIALEAERLRGEGMSADDALAAARRAFGNATLARERFHESRRTLWWDDFRRDSLYGLRALRKSPGFASVAIATLALGIGANSAVFSVIQAVLLRPLPFREPDRIVGVTRNQSLPDLDDIAARSGSFESIGAVHFRALDYTGGDAPVQLKAGLCALRYFEVFGVRAERGRLIGPEDDLARAGRVVVVSHAFWADRMGSDPGVLGRTIPLSGEPYTIVGVLPASVRLPGAPADVWASELVVEPRDAPARDVHILHAFMRLKKGVSIERAQSELHAIDRWLEQAYPDENSGRRRDLEPLREMLVADSRRALLVLFGAVGLVLLIACANFAGLQLARGSSRRREMAIRGALGAGRWRLVRQMLTESVLLSLLGGAAGLGLAHLGARALVSLRAGSDARLVPIRIDAVVFAFTAVIAAGTGLVFGLVPALAASRLDPQAGLRGGSGGQSASGREVRLRRALVVSEIALALMLLAGAGLLIRSFRNLRSVEPGFRADHVLTMRLELPEARYEELSKQRLFRSRLLDSLNALPGVDAALVSELPMDGDALTQHFVIDGRPPVPVGEAPEVLSRTVTRKYLRLLQIPLRAGRDFEDRDREDSPLVAIVNQSFVRANFPSGSAVGARVSWAPDPGKPPEWMTIVGVAGDVNHFGPARPEEPAVYDLYEQTPRRWKRWMFVVVRSPSEPATLLREVTARIWELDRQLPPTNIRAMSEVVEGSTESQKFNLLLLGAFAVLALALASIGVYGLIAYSVARRRREIGVRMALGATSLAIVESIVFGAVRLAAAGAAIGVAGALLVTRLMTKLLFGVGPRDPATLAGVVGILALVAVIASWIPARSAARVPPMSALRAE